MDPQQQQLSGVYFESSSASGMMSIQCSSDKSYRFFHRANRPIERIVDQRVDVMDDLTHDLHCDGGVLCLKDQVFGVALFDRSIHAIAAQEYLYSLTSSDTQVYRTPDGLELWGTFQLKRSAFEAGVTHYEQQLSVNPWRTRRLKKAKIQCDEDTLTLKVLALNHSSFQAKMLEVKDEVVLGASSELVVESLKTPLVHLDEGACLVVNSFNSLEITGLCSKLDQEQVRYDLEKSQGRLHIFGPWHSAKVNDIQALTKASTSPSNASSNQFTS